VGGGSAGHVAPTLAVIDELARRHPNLEVRFWCDRGYVNQSASLMRHAHVEVKVEKIYAGKYRRYHGASLMSRLTDIATFGRNLIDTFAVAAGFIQSLIKLIMWRPTVVFCKGGFVCLPVGYAAHLLRIPLVIHDSDAQPGLTNRLLASCARYIGTGAPLEYYNYPEAKAHYTGIPVKPEFRLYSKDEKVHAKQLFQLPADRPLLVVMGGGLGAQRINDAMVAIAPTLSAHMSVFHLCGVRQYVELKQKLPATQNYKLMAFLSDHLAQLLGASDVVVSRVGASAMAELAAAAASVIMVPSRYLADQQKNAVVYARAEAAVLLDEVKFGDNPHLLQEAIEQLLKNPATRDQLSQKLHALAKPEAATEMANLIEQAGGL